MKKRILPLLMALCLTLSLVPMALAAEDQPDTITLPNGEVREIPNAELDPIMPAGVSDLEVDEEGYYVIKDEKDFGLVAQSEWYANKKFRVKGDLNLTELGKTVNEWGGYISYFYGTLEGVEGTYGGEVRYPKITGIPNNCALIYAIIGGTIKNLIFEHEIDNTTKEKGSASFITFMPSTLGGKGYHLTMENVTVTGSISLTGSDQSNYAPFVYCAPPGGITMTGCVNEADITGSIYGSVFYGYYPLYTGSACQYKFDKCVNSGDVTMQYAGMFFGNSSSIEGKVGNLYLEITDCENNGEIRGTSGAKHFAAPVSEFENKMEEVETFLQGTASTTTQPNNMTLHKVEGSLPFTGEKLTGLGVTVSGSDISITRPSDEGAVDHYVVSVMTYVNLWYPDANRFYGTDRVVISETISKVGLPDGNIQSELKAYGLADEGVGEFEGFIGDYEVYKDNGVCYYLISNDPRSDGFARYVSNATGTDGKPIGGGTKAAEYVTVYAYGPGSALLDSFTLDLTLPKE